MHTLFRTPVILTVMSLAACGTIGDVSSQKPAPGLTDTAWTLWVYRPAAPGAEDIPPAQREQYRLHFLADGRLAAQIGCNRGNGAWTDNAPTTGGGNLQISGLALTRMMCPPDRIGDLLSQHIQNVQSYRMVDGRLYLEMGSGGGQFIWKRSAP